MEGPAAQVRQTRAGRLRERVSSHRHGPARRTSRPTPVRRRRGHAAAGPSRRGGFGLPLVQRNHFAFLAGHVRQGGGRQPRRRLARITGRQNQRQIAIVHHTVAVQPADQQPGAKPAGAGRAASASTIPRPATTETLAPRMVATTARASTSGIVRSPGRLAAIPPQGRRPECHGRDRWPGPCSLDNVSL